MWEFDCNAWGSSLILNLFFFCFFLVNQTKTCFFWKYFVCLCPGPFEYRGEHCCNLVRDWWTDWKGSWVIFELYRRVIALVTLCIMVTRSVTRAQRRMAFELSSPELQMQLHYRRATCDKVQRWQSCKRAVVFLSHDRNVLKMCGELVLQLLKWLFVVWVFHNLVFQSGDLWSLSLLFLKK